MLYEVITELLFKRLLHVAVKIFECPTRIVVVTREVANDIQVVGFLDQRALRLRAAVTDSRRRSEFSYNFV